MLLLGLAHLPLAAIVAIFYFVLASEAWLANGLLLVLTGCCILPLWMAQRRSRDRAEVIVFFALWFGLTFGFRAFLLLWQPFSTPDLSRFGIPEEHFRGDFYEAMNRALSIALVGLVAVLVGYYMRVGKRIAASWPVLKMKWQSKDYTGRALILFAVGLLAIWGPRIVSSSVLPEHLMFSVTFVFSMMQVLVPVSLFFVWSLLFERKRLDHWMLFGLVLTVFAIYASLSSKGQLTEIVIAIGLAWHYFRAPIRLTGFVLAFLIIVFVIVPLVTLYRAGVSGLDVSGLDRAIAALSGLASLDWNEFWTLSGLAFAHRMDSFNTLLALTQAFPRDLRFLNGQGILKELMEGFVPRFLWPSKPIAEYGAEMSVFVGGIGGAGSVTGVTQIGDLYRNFGVWGVIPGMILIGIALRSMYEWYMRMVRSDNKVGYLLYLGTLNILISGEGTFASLFTVLPRALLVLLVVSVLLRLPLRSLVIVPRTGAENGA
jgi:hypothetical protein